MTSSELRFEEKILYKTRRHWIIPVLGTMKLIGMIALPSGVIAFLISGFSWSWGMGMFFFVSIIVALYDHYLWHHSWLMIGNQKVTLAVRNGIFSQYAMSIRYRNIRDSAVSKNSFFGFFFKYGSLFIRASSGSDGDFTAHHVPKVGKVYALISALSRYSDDERAHINSIEVLHHHHTEEEFGHKHGRSSMTEEEAVLRLKTLPGIREVVPLSKQSREYISHHEEVRNRGITEVLDREHVLAFLHDSLFRDAVAPLARETAHGELYFPGVPFPEIHGKDVVSASPSIKNHHYLLEFFPYAEKDDATVLVGWDD